MYSHRDQLFRMSCPGTPKRIRQLFGDLTHMGFPEKKNMLPGVYFDQLKFHFSGCSRLPTQMWVVHIVIGLFRPLKYRDLSPKLWGHEGRPRPVSCWPLTSRTVVPGDRVVHSIPQPFENRFAFV